MKMAIVSQSGAALLYTSGGFDRYMPAKQRLIVYYLILFDIIMELRQSSNNSAPLYAVFCTAAMLSSDAKLSSC